MSTITVTQTKANVNVNSTTNTVTVTQQKSNIVVSASGSNSQIRAAISVTDTGGDGSLTYNNGTGVFTYTGPSATDVRSHFSNTAPITYSSSTGVIGVDSSALFSGKTTDDLPEGSVNFYSTPARVATGVDAYTGAFANAQINTTQPIITTGNVDAGLLNTATVQNTAGDIDIRPGTNDATNFHGSKVQLGSGTVLQTKSNVFLNDQSIVYVGSNGTPGAASGGRKGHIHFGDATYSNFFGFRSNGGDGLLSAHNDLLLRPGFYPGYNAEVKIQAYYPTAPDGVQVYDSARYYVEGGGQCHTINPGNINNSYSREKTAFIIKAPYGSSTAYPTQSQGELLSIDGNGLFVIGEVTADGYSIPIKDGTHGQALISQGNGAVRFTNANAQVVSYISTIPLSVGGNLSVTGNLDITGNINYENVVDLNVQDQQITLNANAASDATVSIIANRPTGTDAVLRWNETSDIWEFNNTGGYFPLATSTTDLAEGTNLYYTDGRFDTRFTSKSTSDLSEGTNLYYTNGRADARVNLQTGSNLDLSSKSTSDLAEGTNLYYTTARANSAIGAYQGSISTAGTVTAALDSGKIYIGNQSNVSTTVAPSNNFDISGGSSVDTTVAITLIQAKDNNSSNSPPGDLVQLTGGQIISDGTLITISGVTTGNATGLNGNSYYAFYFTGPDNGYALYTNADQTGNVAVVTGYNTSGLGSATYTTLGAGKFELANALANVNEITSEAGNDKFTFKALLGGSDTSTNSGNITSDGYEIIIDGSHTYASAGNVAQTGSNNLNGYAVSGSFTSGSNAMTITGVTELKNVFNYSGSIDGTNNNTGLTSSMVAGMIYDSSNGVDGDQYPLPQGTTLLSANASTLVFSENATASQSFSNAEPIAIVHGGKDAKNGQLISFVSQDDFTPDGTANVSIESQSNGGLSTLSDQGITPTGNETSATILVTNVGAGAPTDLAVGTAVTFTGLSGAGSGSINGATHYIGRQFFGAGMYALFKSPDGTTTPLTTSDVAIVQPCAFDGTGTGGGTYQYSTGAQSTSDISKSRLYVKDAYGYPYVGPKQTDFAYSIGSASDYVIDYSAATTSVRGRTSLEAPKQVLKAPIGLTIGENTTMSNRGDNDAFTNFGLNFVWDGLTNYTTEYSGSSGTSLVPQMLFKNYTDNTFASSTSGLGRGGPRLFFSSNNGNINTNQYDKYPRKSQEIGRMMFWGATQSLGDSMSTVNPAGYISATASEDWTTSNRLEMSLAANGTGANNADVFLNYRNGKVVLASGSNGSTNEAIHFAPALQGAGGNAAQTYATLGHTWANVNYANVSAQQGSKFTITQGTTAGANSGDLTLSLDREYIAGTASQTLETQVNAGFSTLTDQGITPTGNETSATILITNTGGGTPLGALSVGTAVTFTGVLGAGNTSVNGATFYIGRQHFGAGMYSLFKSSDGTTTPATTTDIAIVQPAAFDATGTGGGSYSYTVTGTAAKQWDISLDVGSDDLKLKSGTTTKVTFTDSYTALEERLRLKSYTTTEVNALSSPAAGDVVFNTTLNLICVYNGSSWRKINDAAM